MEITENPYHQSDAKRALDIAVSSTVLPAAYPAELAVGLYLRSQLNDGGGMYFTQERRRGDGQGVHVKKLRTMHITNGPTDTELNFSQDNPRIPSAWVKRIRKARLDELPQIGQVLSGDMTLVGPRAQNNEYIDFVKKTADRDLFDAWLPAIDSVKPGLTGLAQLTWLDEPERGKTVIENSMLGDIKYVREASLTMDLKILTQTVYRLVKTGLRRQGKGQEQMRLHLMSDQGE